MRSAGRSGAYCSATCWSASVASRQYPVEISEAGWLKALEDESASTGEVAEVVRAPDVNRR
jgi:hypothetical protein